MYTATRFMQSNTQSTFMEANSLPNNGTASDVAGIVSATIFKNTVNDSKIVTPERCGGRNNVN